MFSNYLMYKYVNSYCDIHFEYFFFNHIYIIKKCCEFSFLNYTFSVIFSEKPNFI